MTEYFNPNNSQIGDKRAVAFIDEELDESLEKVKTLDCLDRRSQESEKRPLSC